MSSIFITRLWYKISSRLYSGLGDSLFSCEQVTPERYKLITLDFKGSTHPDFLRNCCVTSTTCSVEICCCCGRALVITSPDLTTGETQLDTVRPVMARLSMRVPPSSCIQNRTWLSFVAAENRYSDLQTPVRGLRINVAVMVLMMRNLALDKGWMRGIGTAGEGGSVSHFSSCLCVCIHSFCFGGFCPVWSRLLSQALVGSKPGQHLAYMLPPSPNSVKSHKLHPCTVYPHCYPHWMRF